MSIEHASMRHRFDCHNSSFV